MDVWASRPPPSRVDVVSLLLMICFPVDGLNVTKGLSHLLVELDVPDRQGPTGCMHAYVLKKRSKKRLFGAIADDVLRVFFAVCPCAEISRTRMDVCVSFSDYYLLLLYSSPPPPYVPSVPKISRGKKIHESRVGV